MTELEAAAPAIADIIILAVMGVSLVFGLFRGLLRELLSLVSWILAFWIAYRYSASVAQILDKALQNPTLSQAVSAVFVFVFSGFRVFEFVSFRIFEFSRFTIACGPQL